MSRRLVVAGVVLGLVALALLGLGSRAPLEVGAPTMTGRYTPRDPGFTLTPISITPVVDEGAKDSRPLDIPPWVSNVLAVVLAAILIGTLVYLASRVRMIQLARRRPRETARPGEVLEISDAEQRDLGAAFSEVLAGLRSGADVDGAVVQCWRQVEALAARQGLPRHPAQTAEEFTLHVLSGSRARPDDMRQLAGLYRAAMFSTRRATEADRDIAITCLEGLSRDLVSLEPVTGTDDAH